MYRRLAALIILHLYAALALASATAKLCGPGYSGIGAEQGILHPVPAATVETSALRTEIHHGRSREAGVSIVVPVYRELENGNLVRLLDSFTAQSAASPNFELVFVVNNTAEVARGETPEARSVHGENLDTLRLLEYVGRARDAEPEVMARLTSAQREVVRRARERPLGIRIIDRATEGTERNIGRIRDFGVKDVIARYPVHETKRLIAMLDGDTIVPRDYVENIMVHFATRPIDTLFIPMDFRIEPGSERWLYESSIADRSAKAQTLLDRAIKGDPRHGGPQTVATNTAFDLVGGVPHLKHGEDSILSTSLGRLRVGHATDTQVLTADRGRPDGYDSKLRWRDRDEEWMPAHGPLFSLKSLAVRAIEGLVEHGELTEAKLALAFHNLGVPLSARDYLAKRAELIESEMVQALADSPVVRKMLEGYGLTLTRKTWNEVRDRIVDGRDPLQLFDHDGAAKAIELLTLFVQANGKAYDAERWAKATDGVPPEFPTYYSRPGGSWIYLVMDRLKVEPSLWQGGIVALLEKRLPPGELAFFRERLGEANAEHEQSIRRLRAALLHEIDPRVPLVPGTEGDPMVREFMEGNTWLKDAIAAGKGAGKDQYKIFYELKEKLADWLEPLAQTPFRRRVVEARALTLLIREAESHPERYPELRRIIQSLRGNPR